MPVLRKVKNRNYTVIDNNVFYNHVLSFKAKGILCQMLSLPDDWEYSIVGVSKLGGDGVASTKTGLQELCEYGYLERRQIRDEHGRIVDIQYYIYEVPNVDAALAYRKSLESRKNSKKSDSDKVSKKLTELVKNQDDSKIAKIFKSPESSENTSSQPQVDFLHVENRRQLNTNKINYNNKSIYKNSCDTSCENQKIESGKENPKAEIASTEKELSKRDKVFYETVREFNLESQVVETLKDFRDARKENGAPMTIRALKILCKKLISLSDNALTQQRILEESILHNWRSVYPLRPINDKVNNDDMMHADYDFEELEKSLTRN